MTATADGEVQIRRIAGENEGEVLGSVPVTAGANENVRITLLTQPNADSVLAVLVEGGVDVTFEDLPLPQGAVRIEALAVPKPAPTRRDPDAPPRLR